MTAGPETQGSLRADPAARPDAALPSLLVEVVPVTPFRQNASVLVCTRTRRAAIVDPGGDLPLLLAALRTHGATPESILLTHGHIDHAGAAAELAEMLAVPVIGPAPEDAFLLDGLVESGRRFGLDARPVTPDRWLEEGESVAVGAASLEVFRCPGHTPGHVVFLDRAGGVAIVGDTLFAGTIGRTDFPYGSQNALIAGIRRVLMPLGDEVRVLPGHGAATTVGRERGANPFLRF